MSVRRKMFDEDMRSVVGDLGEEVTINSQTLSAVPGEISEGTALQLEGYLPEITASFTFRRSDLDSLPKAQDTLVFDGTTYRVLVPVKTPKGGSLVVECGAESA